jgi:hypothetical protein
LKSTTYIHPNLILFWNLLAYPKLLFKVGFITLIILLYTSYLFSRSEAFVETVSTITKIELANPGYKSYQYRFNVSYGYFFKNIKYEGHDTHFMPRGLYPNDSNPKDAAKAQQYVSDFKKSHLIGSDMKILVNSWQPKLSGFEVTSKSWFGGFIVSFVIYYWFPLMLTLVLISMFIKYFFKRIRNDI